MHDAAQIADLIRKIESVIEAQRPLIGAVQRPLIDAVHPHAVIDGLDCAEVEPTGEAGFAIRPSEGTGPATALIMPDLGPCAACVSDVTDPANPRASPARGPRLEYWDAAGRALAARHDALLAAADAIRAGKIVAVKGVGGFQLLVDARDERAVVRLRDRNHRPDKPFALLFPSLDSVESACAVSDLEARLLGSPRSPIRLLRARRGASPVCPSVPPGN